MEGTGTTITECMQPPVGQLPGLLFCANGDSPMSHGVQKYGIHVSDSLDGDAADGRFSLAGLLRPSHAGHSEHKMRI